MPSTAGRPCRCGFSGWEFTHFTHPQFARFRLGDEFEETGCSFHTCWIFGGTAMVRVREVLRRERIDRHDTLRVLAAVSGRAVANP